MFIHQIEDIDLSMVDACNHEEVDTRVFRHAKQAAQAGHRITVIKTVDTDVVVIAISLASVHCKSTSYGLNLVLANRNGGYQYTRTLQIWGKTHVVVFCSGTHSQTVIQCLHFLQKEKKQREKLGQCIQKFPILLTGKFSS
jgi:DNA-binding NarL/FixJ family response regulator